MHLTMSIAHPYLQGLVPRQRLRGHAAELHRDVDGLLPGTEPEAGHVRELQGLLVLVLKVLQYCDFEIWYYQLGSWFEHLEHSVSSLAAVGKLVAHLHPLEVLLQFSHLVLSQAFCEVNGAFSGRNNLMDVAVLSSCEV